MATLAILSPSLQVALERTKPGGSVLGIDVLPAQPPKGISAIHGNFLSPAVRDLVKSYLRESHLRRLRALPRDEEADRPADSDETVVEDRPSYIERQMNEHRNLDVTADVESGHLVDVCCISSPDWLSRPRISQADWDAR